MSIRSRTGPTGATGGIGTPRRKATNWVIEAIPKTSIPSTSFAFPGLPQRHDHPREPCLLSREGGWQDAAYGPETTIQPEFT